MLAENTYNVLGANKKMIFSECMHAKIIYFCCKNYWQENGKMIVSMDALFGLCRKKAAGKSVEPPLHNGLFLKMKEK